MDRLTMPILYGCTVMVLSGPYRVLQEGKKSWGGRSLLLGETRKRVQGADSTCPRCGEEEDLEHILRACLELDSPRRKNFMQVPLLLSAMLTDQVEVAPFFREVFE
jgi:hypothetical protein